MALWDHVEDRGARWGQPDKAARPAGALPAFLAARPRPALPDNDNRGRFFDQWPADELNCLRHVLKPALLREAEARARKLGLGAEQVLIRWGVIEEEYYLQRLSIHTGIEMYDLDRFDLADCPLRDDQIKYAAIHGIVPLDIDDHPVQAIAPRLRSARTLCRLVAEHPHLRSSFRLVSASALQQFLTRQGGTALARTATRGLHETHPSLSAAPARRTGPWRGRLRRGCAVALIALLPPIVAPAIWSGLLALWFVVFVVFRLAAALRPRSALRRLARVPDDRLPVYTVISALYHEASSVAPLMAAIDTLDYPREKLDVILVTEPDDLATRMAIAQLGSMPHVRTLVAPAVAPQTKPKALNFALPFAYGSFVAVFDAEDRPEAGQLRAALDAFERHGRDLACAQASLCIDNETNSWLSRMFAAEYAGQFDVYLPGMSEMKLPLPLGGSSNHFRTATLREVGGWDACNVTEDADLGFRLARFGYRSVSFPSTTFEEAPIRPTAWLKQRSRWMKGWLQTWCVHMRDPRQLWRDAGWRGFATLNFVAGGNVLTALAYPVMLYAVLRYFVDHASGAPWPGWAALPYLLGFMAGIASTVTLGLLGLSRRSRLREGWILLLTAPYWFCLSIAAWRAVFQYIWNPYHWEKTEHGVARRGPNKRSVAARSPSKRQR
ncbi:MAG: glycosyltransferase family 2 protein [Tardiphaga sp.]